MNKAAKVSAALKHAAGTAKSTIIQQPEMKKICLEIEGTAPLIQNAFPQKVMEQMLRKHMGLPNQREKKKPREVLEAAMIRNEAGRICIPPAGLKKAMLTASATVKTLKVNQLKVMMFVVGQSVPITFEKMVPRMDMCRTSGISRAPDVRFRPSFLGWKARLILEFGDQLRVETMVDLLSRAGAVGVGEWRPVCSGTYGTFQVSRSIETAEEAAEVIAECASPIPGWTIPDWAMDADIDMTLLQKIIGGDAAGDEQPVSGEEEATG